MAYCKMIRKVFETQKPGLDRENVYFQAEANNFEFLIFNNQIYSYLEPGLWQKTSLTLKDLET